jgi:hypothetical protein
LVYQGRKLSMRMLKTILLVAVVRPPNAGVISLVARGLASATLAARGPCYSIQLAHCRWITQPTTGNINHHNCRTILLAATAIMLGNSQHH